MDGWIGAIAGIIGAAAGIAGVGVAVWAVLLARKGDGVAERAVQIAERSNEIAVESRDFAAEANTLAVEANQLSKDANSIAGRNEQRAIERNDVVWESQWQRPGWFAIVNRGQDEARNVRAVVTVDDEEEIAEQEICPGGGVLLLEFPRAADQQAREAREIAAKMADPMYFRTGFEGRDHWIEWRVTWETALGKHASRDYSNNMATLE